MVEHRRNCAAHKLIGLGLNNFYAQKPPETVELQNGTALPRRLRHGGPHPRNLNRERIRPISFDH